MKKVIAKILILALKEKEIELEEEKIINLLEEPPNSELGDYAFPCFSLANQIKLEPSEIAKEIRSKIANYPETDFSDIQTNGPYINFFVNRTSLAINLLNEILRKKDNFGKTESGKNQKTMVEFPSPNTNKPLHLGHLRNMAIGESISRILEFNSEKVIRANLYNDRGIHICKSMLAYQKYGKGEKPSNKLKSDHLVGKYYVVFNKKSKEDKQLEIEAHEMLRKWEAKDKIIISLWKKMNRWALKGFKETYKTFEIKHDKEYFESEIYTKGKKIILEGVKKGSFQKMEDGSVKFNLNKDGLGEKYLLRADGTSLYVTQDIYLAHLKQKEFKLTKSYYIAGREQEYHFNVLFKLLEKLGFKTEGLKHFSYGMVNLPEGKMKSREGNVVDGDDLIKEIKRLVENHLKKEKLTKKEIEKRSLTIALASIKYMILKVDATKDVTFDPKKSISFEGNTGPYLLYSYARANSILKKSRENNENFKIKELDSKEIELIKKLEEFKTVVKKSYEKLNPSLIANYSYELAQIFNEFYHLCPVINSKNERFRLNLIKAFMQVEKNSLNLLGINVLKRM